MKKNYTSKTVEERQAEVDALIARAQEGIYAFRESDKFRDYLMLMTKFHSYSARNILLIQMQYPGASRVASFAKWKEFNRSVSAGQHGIKILCPSTRKTTCEVTRVDDATGEETISEETRSVVYGFRVGYVFDVSQTQQIPGKPEIDMSLCSELTGDVENFSEIINALRDIADVPVTIASYPGTSKGYYRPATGDIVVQANMSQLQTVKTLIHEIAHSILHNPREMDNRGHVSADVKETEAEATAFVVANFLGLDTSDYSFPYLTGWASLENGTVLKSVNSIRKAADAIITKLDERL